MQILTFLDDKGTNMFDDILNTLEIIRFETYLDDFCLNEIQRV